MSEVPDVLRPLVEFEEEDGGPVDGCGCKYLPLRHTDVDVEGAVPPWMVHCSACGNMIGRAADGTTYRVCFSRIVEAMESLQAECLERGAAQGEGAELEAALEQAQADRDFARLEAARLMDLLIVAQANENHLRRALEWVAGAAFEAGWRAPIEKPGEPQMDAILRESLAATEEGPA